MAIPSNAYKTYDTIGIAEDVIDIITNIDPVDTFVTSNTSSKRCYNTYHEWQTDALDTAGPNAVLEGDDATASALVPTTRVGNYTQILRKTIRVTDTDEAVKKYGRTSEVALQKAKKLKEMARDMEYALVINSASCVGSSNAARTLKGLDGWISTNCTYGGASIGISVTLSEGNLNDCLQAMWAVGGRPQHALCGAFQKRQIDALTTNTREIMAADKTVVRAVDVYKSSFGDIQVRLHQQVNTTIPSKVLILGDMDLWAKAFLRPVKWEELARTGASKVFMVEAELTLESLQEKGAGKIAGLKTA